MENLTLTIIEQKDVFDKALYSSYEYLGAPRRPTIFVSILLCDIR